MKVIRTIMGFAGGVLIAVTVLWVALGIYFVFNPMVFTHIRYHWPIDGIEMQCPTFRVGDQTHTITATILNTGPDADFEIFVWIYDKRFKTQELCTQTEHLLTDETLEVECPISRAQVEANTQTIEAAALSSADNKPITLMVNSSVGKCGVVIDPVQRLLLPSLVGIYVILIGVAMIAFSHQ